MTTPTTGWCAASRGGRPIPPDQVLPDSPTGKVAGGAVEGDVPYTVAMLSLDNVFSSEDFTAWTASLVRRIGHDVEQFSVEPKLDGLAIAARYTHGRLTRLITRGDGTAGEDVSHAIGTIEGLPSKLAGPVTVEVRGEVLMHCSVRACQRGAHRARRAPTRPTTRSSLTGQPA